MGSDLGIVALNTLAIYLFLVVVIRLIGRRQLGQLSALDLVTLLLLGSAVETAMVHGSTTLGAGLVSAAVLLGSNNALNLAMVRSRTLRRLVGGGPLVLIHDGKFVEENLKRAGLTPEDVLEGIREREAISPDQIRFAVLEADGEINVALCANATSPSPRPLPS